MEWQDITYDIPLPKAEKKAALSKALEDSKVEEGVADVSLKVDYSHGAPAAGHRRILNGLKGSVRRGQMVAVLGASGAGKTTLLNILSARLDATGKGSGKVTFEGKARDPKSWKRTVGFVEQDDLLISFLTVKETLQSAARLRLPEKLYTTREKQDRVEETIDILRLEKAANTRIGSTEKRGISGGERKRVAIGTELVSDVSLLLLDEPTSGLDSFQAVNVVTNLKEIAQKRNLACLMTIHQPSFKVFSEFDQVILLTRGGVFYSGPPQDSIKYFEGLGMPVPVGSNPADHFINIAENLDRSEESEKRIQSLLTSWHEHQHGVAIGGGDSSSGTLSRLSYDDKSLSDDEKAHIAAYQNWPTSWMSEFTVLTQRKLIQVFRNPLVLIGTAAQTFVLCVLVGFAFFRLKYSQADVLARIGLLFFIPINSSFAVVFPILAIFPLQRAIMRRERSSGLYRTSSFYLSQLVVEIPSQLAQRLLFYVLIYFMTGLRQTADAFFIYLAVNFVQVVSAIGIGFAIGSISPSVEIANILAPLVNVIFVLFGGQLLPDPPPWYVWIRWISPITYAYSALSQNEYKGEVYDCTGAAANSQCYPNGESVLRKYNLQDFTIGENIGFLFAIISAWFLLGYVALRFLGHPRFRYI